MYGVEYSLIQKAFHIDTLEVLIKSNRYAIRHNIINGYMLLGLFETYEEAFGFMNSYRVEVDNSVPALNLFDQLF